MRVKSEASVLARALEKARDKFREYGIEFSLPSDGDLDDLERERYEALGAALAAALSSVRPMMPAFSNYDMCKLRSPDDDRPEDEFEPELEEMTDDDWQELENEMNAKDRRKEIMRLMRQDFDPTQDGWEGYEWHDNAEDVTDRIEELFASDLVTAENERLRAALEWMDNLDPQLVEAARQKFGLPRSPICRRNERLRHECAKSGLHDHDGCSCTDAELLASLSARCEELDHGAEFGDRINTPRSMKPSTSGTASNS